MATWTIAQLERNTADGGVVFTDAAKAAYAAAQTQE